MMGYTCVYGFTRWIPVLAFACILSVAASEDRSQLPPTCESFIYCHGPLLDTIQMAAIYNDSKTFVDMKMKHPPERTYQEFVKFMNLTNNKPTKFDISLFVAENFEEAGSEFSHWDPTDWKPHPAFLHRIKDEDLLLWGKALNELWKELGRQMKEDVKLNQDLYSIIYVDNPVIVPGGRFREFYYWDSYWIIRGLLLSEMKQTARGMLNNFLSIVKKFGHIPNGGRIYYIMRSQPPLLVPMVKSYYDFTRDIDFIKDNIEVMEKEFEFWMRNHTVEIEKDNKIHKLARYIDQSKGPRPESYREDVKSADHFDTKDKKEEHYAELKSAAESGWDFSSRWFVLNGTNKGNLTNLKTRSILPVDLNSMMQWNAALLAEFYKLIGNCSKEAHYRKIAEQFTDAIEKVLWHEEVGTWLDYDLSTNKRREYFYPSNVAPLWTNSYNISKKEYFVSRIMNYLDVSKVDNYEGGIPTTFAHSGEQWDFPNAWPPLQYIMIIGLSNTGVPSATRLAHEWATKWVRSNYETWRLSKKMLEKYDASTKGGLGGGGEYELQTGFGWTNGIIMELLDTYGADDFEAASAGVVTQPIGVVSEAYETSSRGIARASVGVGGILTALLVVLATLTAGALGFLVYKKHKEQKSYSSEGLHLLRSENTKGYTELHNINGLNGKKRLIMSDHGS